MSLSRANNLQTRAYKSYAQALSSVYLRSSHDPIIVRRASFHHPEHVYSRPTEPEGYLHQADEAKSGEETNGATCRSWKTFCKCQYKYCSRMATQHSNLVDNREPEAGFHHVGHGRGELRRSIINRGEFQRSNILTNILTSAQSRVAFSRHSFVLNSLVDSWSLKIGNDSQKLK